MSLAVNKRIMTESVSDRIDQFESIVNNDPEVEQFRIDIDNIISDIEKLFDKNNVPYNEYKPFLRKLCDSIDCHEGAIVDTIAGMSSLEIEEYILLGAIVDKLSNDILD